jgi:hypothetical protein
VSSAVVSSYCAEELPACSQSVQASKLKVRAPVM